MKSLALVWVALMVLLALTTASAMVPLGAVNAAVNFGIAVAKTVLVALFFMHLRHSIALLKLIVIVGVYTLGVLMVLSGADFVSRHIERSAWQHAGGVPTTAITPAGQPDRENRHRKPEAAH